MVQVIETSDPRNKLSEMLGMSLGQGLGNGLNTFFANRSLDSVLHDKALENAPQSKKLEAMRSALSPYGEIGQEIFKNRLMIDQEEKNEAEQGVLGKIHAGKEISEKEWAKISPQNQHKAAELIQKKQGSKSIYNAMLQAGIPEETAKMYQELFENSPTGGQTDIIRAVNDQIKRHKLGRGEVPAENKINEEDSISVPGTGLAPMKLKLPQEPEEIGVTSADIVKRQDRRQAINVPKYDEAIDRLQMSDDDFKDFEYMEELNEEPGALPTGIEKWNVNWETGEFRVPALATPQAQAYMKTLARQLSRAKNDFPGRVTNFDLEQFKKKFPTLANSPEGRALILQQLKTANRIAFLKDETLKKAYDHYGSSADPMFVRKVADENYRSMKKNLENHLKELNNQANQMSPEEAENEPQRPSLEDIFK
jgi:hypothetical protein